MTRQVPWIAQRKGQSQGYSFCNLEVAKQIGEAFKSLKIPVGKVYTGRYQRAIETGKLIGGGEVTPTIDLTEGGLIVSSNENNRRTEALRSMVATGPGNGKNTLLVTHRPNIIDAFGKDLIDMKEADAAIFRPNGMKGEFVARVQAGEWIKATP